jgi:hypothetical protein
MTPQQHQCEAKKRKFRIPRGGKRGPDSESARRELSKSGLASHFRKKSFATHLLPFQTHSVFAMAGQQRKLKAEGSNPEAPTKKSYKTSEEIDDDEFDESDVKGMFKALMHQMRNVTGAVETATKMAAEAKQAASDAKEAATIAQNEVGHIRQDMETLKAEVKELQAESSKKAVRETVADAISSFGGAGLTQGFGKGGGKDAKKREDKSKTLVFSNFPSETQEDDIIRKITEIVAEYKADVEEVYAFAKTGTKGAAKFTSEGAMWKYMTEKKGQHNYQFEGNKIYAKAGGGDMTDADERREKAVRKAVRVLIEHEGGNGDATKQRIDAKYRWGCVWMKKPDGKWEKVAQWNATDSHMTMLGSAASLQGALDALLR